MLATGPIQCFASIASGGSSDECDAGGVGTELSNPRSEFKDLDVIIDPHGF